MIVVTGASGKLGSLIAHALLARIGTEQFAAMTRDPSKANDLTRRGVRVRQGDFNDPGSLLKAFKGAKQLLMISSNVAASGGDPIAQHRDAIAAAKASGVRRIVYTSHMGASATSAFKPMHAHAATEVMLAESGMAWTALRNGSYASTVPQLIGDAAETGVLEVPADGPVAWTAHVDLASAAARVLADEGRFDGPTPSLTAAAARDMTDIAAILSARTGRSVERKVVSDEEEERRLAARGLPTATSAIMLGLYRAARVREFAATDPTLEHILGSTPRSLEESLN